MSRRKKKFSCGHKGYGRICHRCAQKPVKKANSDRKLKISGEACLSASTPHPRLTKCKQAQPSKGRVSYTGSSNSNSQWQKRRQDKLEWEAAFARDPIDLRNLPKNVVIKSRRIIERLEICSDYRQFYGKRLRYDRLVISIPVTRNYRLICRDCGNLLVPEAVVSHEDYNVVKPGR